ncbi:hypothetical protein AAFF_G00109580 [Aldrovandia affinis]|uniref:Uncharacterized protein n=1 Tax=Aldrovandia affinis TaxID=143900 RepID=A0AAD7RTR5_9TELE|nr:hypothetical protein AAFF_G00109580 [Aldrovandia affinis]
MAALRCSGASAGWARGDGQGGTAPWVCPEATEATGMPGAKLMGTRGVIISARGAEKDRGSATVGSHGHIGSSQPPVPPLMPLDQPSSKAGALEKDQTLPLGGIGRVHDAPGQVAGERPVRTARRKQCARRASSRRGSVLRFWEGSKQDLTGRRREVRPRAFSGPIKLLIHRGIEADINGSPCEGRAVTRPHGFMGSGRRTQRIPAESTGSTRNWRHKAAGACCGKALLPTSPSLPKACDPAHDRPQFPSARAALPNHRAIHQLSNNMPV